jgi:sugar-specific transcriptional regulator TrmB
MMPQTQQTQANTTSLYEQDYYLWVETTLKQLIEQKFEAVDWKNLIEEVADLSRREKRKLENLLTRLFEHLLKLSYWHSERVYNDGHWKAEIRNFRKQIKRELKASPSLKVYLVDIFQECYQDAREIVADLAKLPLETFPVQSIATIEQVLDENWLPE